MSGFAAGAMHDPEVFRGLIESLTCLATPQEVLARPGMRERVAQWGSAGSPPVPGPDRPRLMELLTA